MKKKATGGAGMFEERGAGEIYAAVIDRLRARIGAKAAVEDPKQSCVHVTAGPGGTAFAGLHPRTGAVLLNILTFPRFAYQSLSEG